MQAQVKLSHAGSLSHREKGQKGQLDQGEEDVTFILLYSSCGRRSHLWHCGFSLTPLSRSFQLVSFQAFGFF